MTTEKQLAANAQNALNSTGPKTDEGKAAVRFNAMKHGLLSTQVLLPNEDEAALLAFGMRLRSQMQPVGELETLLVDRIVSSSWRLCRLMRVESGLFAVEYFGILARRARQAAECATKKETVTTGGLQGFGDVSDILGTTTTTITIMDPAAHERALQETRDAAAQTETETATLGEAFRNNATGTDAFSKLSRYETMIERSLYKALHELQRLQAARGGKDVPLPMVVDVDVSGERPAALSAGGDGTE